MKISLTLNEDHIRLIKNLWFQDFGNKVGIDKFDVFGGSRLFEDMARILGLTEHMRPETIDDWDGAKFDDEATNKMMDLADFLGENLLSIEEILHQHCDEGLKVGTYTCQDNVRIWSLVE